MVYLQSSKLNVGSPGSIYKLNRLHPGRGIILNGAVRSNFVHRLFFQIQLSAMTLLA